MLGGQHLRLCRRESGHLYRYRETLLVLQPVDWRLYHEAADGTIGTSGKGTPESRSPSSISVPQTVSTTRASATRTATTAHYEFCADSTACRARIPRDAGPVFHGMPGHRFHGKPEEVRRAGQPSYRDLFWRFPGRSTVAQARLSVRKIREVLRLKSEARLSDRQITAVLGSVRSTVQECLRRARTAGWSWPLPDLDDEQPMSCTRGSIRARGQRRATRRRTSRRSSGSSPPRV